MRTEQLIAELASDTQPVARAGPRLVLALLAGSALALAALMIVLGSPLQPVAQRGLAASGMKLIYPMVVAVCGAAAVLAAGRPGDKPVRRLLPIVVAVLVVAMLAAHQLSLAAPEARQELLFGSTLARCVTAVTLASVPVFAALTWAFRLLAPTHRSFAGFLIGLCSGGAAATAYALYCPETSQAFLLAAYTPAMLVPGLLGAIAGRGLLRW